MKWLVKLFRREAEKSAVDIACDAVVTGAFDEAIAGLIVNTVRDARDNDLTHMGFLLKIAVELIDRSTPQLSFSVAREIAQEVWVQFRRDNEMVKFGDPGWDWSGAGARILAQEYEIDFWEPTP